uniref:Uncharacterized protein TCIL3000_5_2640 n=1 Tax=Trypanosoma congolense (strain IL3000) TaxID=1068625 RepID=G0UMZ3_TRYCI|nr:unnamed protein product [Trypanosoma congolense IL3000]
MERASRSERVNRISATSSSRTSLKNCEWSQRAARALSPGKDSLGTWVYPLGRDVGTDSCVPQSANSTGNSLVTSVTSTENAIHTTSTFDSVPNGTNSSDGGTSGHTSRSHHSDIGILWRLVHAEQAMRRAAELAVLEEQEKGERGIIDMEANYGARLLHSILLEVLDNNGDTQGQPRSVKLAHEKCPQLRVLKAKVRNLVKKQAPDDKQGSPLEQQSFLPSYEELQEENRLLREQVERYKAIDTEDRLELNAYFLKMKVTIERLVQQRALLQEELMSRRYTADTPRAGSPPTGLAQTNTNKRSARC